MLKALRFALVAVATFSTVMFAGPAFAGMVSTPKQSAGEAQREAAKAMLKSKLAESGLPAAAYEGRIDQMSNQDLSFLTTHVLAARNAGSVGLVIAIGAAVILVVVIVILETFYPWK